MNISFDLFNEYPELQKGVSSEEHVFYTTYLRFVADKLAPLKEQIEKEESEQEGCFTEIHIFRENKAPMSFHNYSTGLVNKMKKRFSTKDFEQLNVELANNQKRLHN